MSYVPQMNLPALFQMAQQMRLGRQQEQQNQLQLSALMEDRQRQQAFRDAVASGDPDAMRKADPMAWLKLQNTNLETQKTKAEIANLGSIQGERTSKAAAEKDAKTVELQKRLSVALETNPAAIGTVRRMRDDAVASKNYNHFTLPGEDTATDTDPETGEPIQTWVQAEPTQKEILTAQAASGIDTAAKSRSLTEGTSALRKEFYTEKPVQAYQVVRQGFANIASASDNGVGDLSRIYSFMKMLDTNSAVKESETAMAAGAGGYIESLKAIVSRIKGVGALTPELRQAFMTEAQKLEQAYRKGYDVTAQNFGRIAVKGGYSPEDVVFGLPDLGQPESQPQDGGTVRRRTLPVSLPPPLSQEDADALADKYGFR
jgi:hypothetical protein